ncbi:hypothetical protein QFC22_006419 [Naganishia vaughanmartiniae]|uniref:Uncharacterized protein n=1 Tax=Naganishia vaughanmartiniae TaxID=1424756 RepID=A0ACC2WJ31_9TREE|nr:hypothetical protein QFC22_006419 [Naganishia vaughanmartiniae]
MDYLKSRLSPDIAVPVYAALGGKGINYADPAHWKQFLVNWEQPWLWICLASVVFNPVFWNTVARNEYRNKSMTKIFGGPYNGTYVLAVIIFSLGIIRDLIYEKTLLSQPVLPAMTHPLIRYAGAAMFIVGQVLVVTSIYALGITGTYLGDYFGILMSHRVTSFPFNVLENPMYNGSTLCFLGTALWYARPAGVVITAVVALVYEIALMYEGPFTSKIYSSAADKKRSDSIKASANDTVKSVQDKGNAILASATSASKSSGTSSARQPLDVHSGNTSGGSSYASAASRSPTSNGVASTDPKPVTGVAHLGLGAAGDTTSPVRSGSGVRTRSRAGRIVDDD